MSGEPGYWVMVCGPSGAGKDSVLDWARAALDGHDRIRFARRMVTRATHASCDHEESSVTAIQALERSGGLAWYWQAHGLHYGVRAEYAGQVAEGHIVVVNGSREHAGTLGGRPDVRCVMVTAPSSVLNQRLQRRGREDEIGVLLRMQRNMLLPQPPADLIIINEAGLEKAGQELRDYLLELESANTNPRVKDVTKSAAATT